MKSTSVFRIARAINIIALAALFAIWWVNGRDDTLLYATFAMVILASFLYISPRTKDGVR